MRALVLALILTSCQKDEVLSIYGQDFVVSYNQTLFGESGDWFGLICAIDHEVIDYIRTLEVANISVLGHGHDVDLRIRKVKNSSYLIDWSSGEYKFTPGKAYIIKVR